MTTHHRPHTRNSDTLYLNDGMELPCFAAFELLRDKAGTTRLHKYYREYIDLALEYSLGFVLESATWRANA